MCTEQHEQLGRLADDLLALYERAIGLEEHALAEKLLEGLETLARRSWKCESARDHAYLRIGRRRSHTHQ